MDAPLPLGNWQASIDSILQDLTERSDEFSIFSSLKTNRKRVDFVIKKNLLRSIDWLPVYFDGCDKGHEKSESVAEVWKNKGNKFFQQKKYFDAVDAYTQACFTAPSKKGNILALSFGNRSAASFHLCRYEACVVDIDRALLQGFPSSSRHKVLLRKINALCKVGNKTKASEGMETLRNFISSKDFKLKGEQKDAFIKDVENLQVKVDALSESQTPSQEKDSKGVGLFAGVNDVVCQASKAVTMTFSPSKGRHLMANQDIPQGSSIIVEKPFSAVLLPDHYDTHCHHCFGRLPLTPIGCEQCSHVGFCDEICRDNAWPSYHSVECSYMYLLHSIGIAHLSLRTVLVAGVDFLKDFLSRPDNHSSLPDGMSGVNAEGRYDRSYLPVYHLMTHQEVSDPQDLLQYSLTAALLLSILVHSGHLDDKLKLNSSSSSKQRKVLLRDLFYGMTPEKDNIEELPSLILDLGSVLLRHILQLVCNAHAITSLLSSSSSSSSTGVGESSDRGLVQDMEQVRIATAIYPTASLMNHSCDPTIVSSFQRDLLTVKTIKDVKKGEEIFNCYGPHSRRMKTSERQEVLQSQYHFVCVCAACSSEPLAHLRFGAYKCHKCSGILSDTSCTECGVPISQEEMKAKQKLEKELNNIFDAGVRALKGKHFRAALNRFEECQTGRRKLLYKDHRELALCEDSLARCYASLGEYSLSADHLYKSVDFCQLIYGSQSVEFGHELQKLSEVLFTAERLAECLDVSQKAYAILRDSYTTGHESLRQLEGLIMATAAGLDPAMSNA